MTLFHHQGEAVQSVDTPWDAVDEQRLEASLLDLFKINPSTRSPELMISYKPYVLLFDEYYTELYRISEAQQRMQQASRIIFIGTSFSVNLTQMALEIAIARAIPIDIVDPEPVHIPYRHTTYHKMRAVDYIQTVS